MTPCDATLRFLKVALEPCGLRSGILSGWVGSSSERYLPPAAHPLSYIAATSGVRQWLDVRQALR